MKFNEFHSLAGIFPPLTEKYQWEHCDEYWNTIMLPSRGLLAQRNIGTLQDASCLSALTDLKNTNTDIRTSCRCGIQSRMWVTQWRHTWTCFPCQTWWSQKAELQEWKEGPQRDSWPADLWNKHDEAYFDPVSYRGWSIIWLLWALSQSLLFMAAQFHNK